MAGPAPLIAPPDGWLAHAFWHNLDLELHARQVGMTAACVCLALLVIGRALLPASDRSRVRLGVLFVLTYIMLVFAKAGMLAAGQDAGYATMHLIALIALYWGMIGLFGLFFFDIIGRRFGVPKILRDLVITILSVMIMVTLLSRAGRELSRHRGDVGGGDGGGGAGAAGHAGQLDLGHRAADRVFDLDRRLDPHR